MKADAVLKIQIEKALMTNTLLSGSTISVEVSDGVAYLGGSTDKYPKRELARKIAKEIQGVKGASEKIKVVVNRCEQCGDQEILKAIIEKFIKNFGHSHTELKTTVKNGQVRLEGTMKWKYQKDLATECILNIPGITEIENNLVVLEKPKAGLDEKDVLAAIYGDPSITTDIKIEIIGNRVVLKGKVYDVEQKNLVTALVRNVQGVQDIENFLTFQRSS